MKDYCTIISKCEWPFDQILPIILNFLLSLSLLKSAMATITVNFINSNFIPYPFKYQFLSNQNSLLADFLNPRKLITLKIQCCTKTSPNKKPRKPPMDKSNSSKNPNSKRAPNRRRSSTSYGTSRKSVLKKSFSQEQVYFSGPVSNDPVVGIIGGGMAGLICALYLEKRGIRSTVFDTVSFFFRFDFPIDSHFILWDFSSEK